MGLKLDGTVWTMTLDPYAPVSLDRAHHGEWSRTSHTSRSSSQSPKMGGSTIWHLRATCKTGWGYRVRSRKSYRDMFLLSSPIAAWAWGERSWSLGDGTFNPRTTPAQVINLHQVVQVSALADDPWRSRPTVQFGFGVLRMLKWHVHWPGYPGERIGIDNAVLVCADHECLVMKHDGTYWRFDVKTKLPNAGAALVIAIQQQIPKPGELEKTRPPGLPEMVCWVDCITIISGGRLDGWKKSPSRG